VKRGLLTALAFVLALRWAVAADSAIEEIDRLEQAVIEAWERSPLVFRRALLVSGSPDAFGSYEPKPDQRYRPRDTVTIYVEPVGYGWRKIDGGLFEIELEADLLIKRPNGDIVTGKENFFHQTFKSHVRNREFFLKINIHLGRPNTGDYIAGIIVRDAVTGKSGSFEVPFTVEEAS
jgi:hypothetical protein